MLVEVKIGALIMDPNSNTPIVVLKGVESEDILPIWVGAFEANAIALEIEKISPQRPMTHDLLRNLIIQTGYKVDKIIISDLKDNTFFAKIVLTNTDSNIIFFDARPSDAIALALRTDCPIYVEKKVFEISSESTIETSETDFVNVEETTSKDEWDDIIY